MRWRQGAGLEVLRTAGVRRPLGTEVLWESLSEFQLERLWSLGQKSTREECAAAFAARIAQLPARKSLRHGGNGPSQGPGHPEAAGGALPLEAALSALAL